MGPIENMTGGTTAGNRLLRSVGAWSNFTEGLVYKAAGNELLKMMETNPNDITAKDVMGLAQKYKLNDESMQKLMQRLDQSGALAAAQSTRKQLLKENAAKEGMIESSKSAEFPGGLDSGTVGDILKVKAKPATPPSYQEKGRTSLGYPISFDPATAQEYVTISGKLTPYNPVIHGKAEPVAPRVTVINPPGVTSTPYVDEDGTPLVMDKEGNMKRAGVPSGVAPTARPTSWTPESAGKATMIDTAIANMSQVKSLFLGDDFVNNPKVNRTNVVNASLGTPFTEGRQASRIILDQVEGKLRVESGAAVPPEEVKRIAKRFIPQNGDDDKTIVMKLNNLEEYLVQTKEKIYKGRAKPGGTEVIPNKPIKDSKEKQDWINRAKALPQNKGVSMEDLGRFYDQKKGKK